MRASGPNSRHPGPSSTYVLVSAVLDRRFPRGNAPAPNSCTVMPSVLPPPPCRMGHGSPVQTTTFLPSFTECPRLVGTPAMIAVLVAVRSTDRAKIRRCGECFLPISTKATLHPVTFCAISSVTGLPWTAGCRSARSNSTHYSHPTSGYAWPTSPIIVPPLTSPHSMQIRHGFSNRKWGSIRIYASARNRKAPHFGVVRGLKTGDRSLTTSSLPKRARQCLHRALSPRPCRVRRRRGRSGKAGGLRSRRASGP